MEWLFVPAYLVGYVITVRLVLFVNDKLENTRFAISDDDLDVAMFALFWPWTVSMLLIVSVLWGLYRIACIGYRR